MNRRVVGGLLWASLVQYFVMLAVVRSAWTTPYSWTSYWISDLGAATCHIDELGHRVCSPWHVAANVSWVVAGICIIAGVALLWREFPTGALSRIGLLGIGYLGCALVLVGFNPEDTSNTVHVLAAVPTLISCGALTFVLGVALLRDRRRPRLGWAAVTLGAVSVCGTIGSLAGIGGTGWGGAWERLALFPVLGWLILCGTALVRETQVR